jgi:hypothetical protein
LCRQYFKSLLFNIALFLIVFDLPFTNTAVYCFSWCIAEIKLLSVMSKLTLPIVRWKKCCLDVLLWYQLIPSIWWYFRAMSLMKLTSPCTVKYHNKATAYNLFLNHNVYICTCTFLYATLTHFHSSWGTVAGFYFRAECIICTQEVKGPQQVQDRFGRGWAPINSGDIRDKYV